MTVAKEVEQKAERAAVAWADQHGRTLAKRLGYRLRRKGPPLTTRAARAEERVYSLVGSDGSEKESALTLDEALAFLSGEQTQSELFEALLVVEERTRLLAESLTPEELQELMSKLRREAVAALEAEENG